jgi:hypothetical protein
MNWILIGICVLLLWAVYRVMTYKQEIHIETDSIKFKKPVEIIDGKINIEDLMKVELKVK